MRTKITPDNELATNEARAYRIEQLNKTLLISSLDHRPTLQRIKALKIASGIDVTPRDHGADCVTKSQADAGFNLKYEAKAPVYHPC
jgi:hypothetical protein